MPTIDIYDKIALSEAINLVQTPEPLVLDLVFKNKYYHSADKVELELVTDSKGMAQFVTSGGPAKPVEKNTKTIQTVTIPRTFESKIFEATELANLKVAGDIYVTDEGAREDAVNREVLRELATLKNRIKRRQEWMAIQALSTGVITIAQDNIAFSVDYGFVADTNTVTLTGTDLWSNSSSNPLTKTDEYVNGIMQRTGYNADVCFLGSTAAKYFKANTAVMKALNNLNYQVGQMQLNGKQTYGGRFIGRINGIDYYEITQTYSTSTAMIGQYLAIYVATESPGFRLHYGPAYRTQSTGLDIIPGEMYVSPYEDPKKQFLEWEVEQKSLPAIHDPNAVVAVTVATS